MSALTGQLIQWDNPIMKLVADDRCRIASTVLFKPGAIYEGKKRADGRIELVELVPLEVPTVKPRRINGRLRGAEVVVKPETVALAIQADRNLR